MRIETRLPDRTKMLQGTIRIAAMQHEVFSWGHIDLNY